ncbi:hypothetical protein CTAYLR_009167 [Chrysophaeum taylorii]|uniref:Prenyltransferase alpha-alpha toroid domain-containing protein n=1 Tax=Chrysophaeum taylorii TaxID=2483200 RepID=A0AAD7UIU4_9STRA|nr:hypothetical protein CTAYLR_009167 [Chrysophaeum taylorii]
MTALYFCVVGLDMLRSLDDVDGIAEWVMRQWTPNGFKGSPDGSPHIAMTYTALAILATLGADLPSVDIRSFQRRGGSFAAAEDCESDVRFSYCAAVIHKLTTGAEFFEDPRPYIESCRCYDGGFGLVPGAPSSSIPTK